MYPGLENEEIKKIYLGEKEEEIIDTVIHNNSSVGYIWAGEVKGKSGIKVILMIKAD